MCGLYSLTIAPEAMKAAFGYLEAENFPPRPVIRPGEPMAIVRRGRDGLRLVRWGLIPHWMKEPPKGRLMINARAETLLDKPSFRGPVRHRRCLVPADGFYEWTGEPGRKRAWLFRRADGGPFAMAGLWERWMGADGSELDTGIIITVDANETAAPIHERMPAILPEAAWDEWLDAATDARCAVRLLRPAPDDLLVAEEAGNPLRGPKPPAQPKLL